MRTQNCKVYGHIHQHVAQGYIITATEMIKLTSQERKLEMIHLKLVPSS